MIDRLSLTYLNRPIRTPTPRTSFAEKYYQTSNFYTELFHTCCVLHHTNSSVIDTKATPNHKLIERNNRIPNQRQERLSQTNPTSQERRAASASSHCQTPRVCIEPSALEHLPVGGRAFSLNLPLAPSPPPSRDLRLRLLLSSSSFSAVDYCLLPCPCQ